MATEDSDPDPPFKRIHLDRIDPEGWLLRQLRIQADGLTGSLPEDWPAIADSRWLGGDSLGWEAEPYYADGLVPLAYLLEDDALLERAHRWIDAFLDSQRPNGWIAPADQDDPTDPWQVTVVLKVLRQAYGPTQDDAILKTMERFTARLHDFLESEPLEDWAKMRWQDLALTLYWLYEQTDSEEVYALIEKVADAGFDWCDVYKPLFGRIEFIYDEPATEWTHDAHVVNHAMGLKAPGVRYLLSGDEAHLATAKRGPEILDRYHGQVTGVFSGDECLAGRSPTRGTETCAVVEYMYSLEELFRMTGEVPFADRLERIGFNALPAALTPRMESHQYDQQVNQVLSTVEPRDWLNEPESNVFEVHQTCCTANFHQGWPKLASSAWFRSADGLVAASYVPCDIECEIDNTTVRIAQTTAYPFSDTADIAVDPASPVEMSLHFRIPGWANAPTLSLPSGEERPATPGEFSTVERTWSPGERVTIEFGPAVETVRGARGSVSLKRGPLVFAKNVQSETVPLPETRGPRSRELHPTEPWAYGLAVDTADPGTTTSYTPGEPGAVPFSTDAPTATLTVEATPLPEWGMENSSAAPIPGSPIETDADTEQIELVPYGCTNLRVTEFPLVQVTSDSE